jgi:hypothetical protein
MNRARAADTGTAAEFRAGEIEIVPDEPEKGHIRVAAEFAGFTVDLDVGHECTLLSRGG